MMKISELAEKLERLKEQHGDIEVEFQHCDSGGDYLGSEEIHDLRIAEIEDGRRQNDKIVLIF